MIDIYSVFSKQVARINLQFRIIDHNYFILFISMTTNNRIAPSDLLSRSIESEQEIIVQIDKIFGMPLVIKSTVSVPLNKFRVKIKWKKKKIFTIFRSSRRI